MTKKDFCKPGVVLLAGVCLAGSAVLTAHAADALAPVSVDERMLQPAVSGVNAKLETGYVHFDLDEDDGKGYLLQGAASIPLGQSFGFQFDAGTLNADIDSEELLAHGVGGHLFWRDPSIGLLGAYGHHVRYGNDVTISRLGGELEWYSGQFTLEAFAGVDHLDTPIGDEHFTAAEAEIAWYATENLRVSAGVTHSFEQTSALLGTEMMLDGTGFAPSLFANAKLGGDDTTVMAGLRVYLGQPKSLMRRHREDDPAIGLFDQIGSATNCLTNGNGGGGISTDFNSATRAIFVPQPNLATYKLDGCDIKQKRPPNS